MSEMKYRYFVEDGEKLADLRAEAEKLELEARYCFEQAYPNHEAWVSDRRGTIGGILVKPGDPIPEGWAWYKTRCHTLAKGEYPNHVRLLGLVPDNRKVGDPVRELLKKAGFEWAAFVSGTLKLGRRQYTERAIYSTALGMFKGRIVAKVPCGGQAFGEETPVDCPDGMRELKHSEWIAILKEGAPFGEEKPE